MIKQSKTDIEITPFYFGGYHSAFSACCHTRPILKLHGHSSAFMDWPDYLCWMSFLMQSFWFIWTWDWKFGTCLVEFQLACPKPARAMQGSVTYPGPLKNVAMGCFISISAYTPNRPFLWTF